MRAKLLLVVVPAAFLLTACHSQGGYMSADPALTYGPGVVEFPEPERVYVPEYRRTAVLWARAEAVEEVMESAPSPAFERISSRALRREDIFDARAELVRQPIEAEFEYETVELMPDRLGGHRGEPVVPPMYGAPLPPPTESRDSRDIDWVVTPGGVRAR